MVGGHTGDFHVVVDDPDGDGPHRFHIGKAGAEFTVKLTLSELELIAQVVGEVHR